jgi:hypothetical protein
MPYLRLFVSGLAVVFAEDIATIAGDNSLPGTSQTPEFCSIFF